MSWREYLGSVEAKLPIPARFGVVDDNDEQCVFVELTVSDRDTGESITVNTRQHVLPLEMLTDREAACVVRDLLRIALVHEIDEAITIGGRRLFDPHQPIGIRKDGNP